MFTERAVHGPVPASSLDCQLQGPLSIIPLKLESPPSNLGPLLASRPVQMEIGRRKHHSSLSIHRKQGIVLSFISFKTMETCGFRENRMQMSTWRLTQEFPVREKASLYLPSKPFLFQFSFFVIE